jgi:glycosyltransferase involved in cell wall biosynthesis
MRILLLTPRIPWPPLDGGRIAMSRLAESLAAVGAEVEILSLNPRKHRASVDGLPLPISAVDIDTSRRMGPALRSVLRGVPYVVARFHSRELRRALDAKLRVFRPDLVQVESPFLLQYVEGVRAACDARVVLRSLNVEFRIWEGLVREEPNAARRLALRRVAASLRQYELRHLNTPDAVVPISVADADDFRRLGCTRPMHVVPCGVRLPQAAVEEPEPLSVGFIGSLDFRPNQHAVEWILDELWPRVTSAVPTARLSIAGSSPPEWLLRRGLAGNIEILANVDDANAFMRRMSILIAPLFAGGGMRIKVLEAMALGKAVVATTLGAGGIEVHDDQDILIADDASTFAESVVRLLQEPATARRLGTAARATTAARYESDTLARGLLGFYELLVARC